MILCSMSDLAKIEKKRCPSGIQSSVGQRKSVQPESNAFSLKTSQSRPKISQNQPFFKTPDRTVF
jgi:hypothetical protein